MPEQLRGELLEWRAIVWCAFPVLDDVRWCARSRSPLGVYARSATAGLVALPVGPNGIARVVHDRGTRIDVPDLRPDDLRRTFAGMLDEQGTRLAGGAAPAPPRTARYHRGLPRRQPATRRAARARSLSPMHRNVVKTPRISGHS